MIKHKKIFFFLEFQKNLERIKCILNEAFEVDEQGKDDDALELYLEAAELCIKIVSGELSTCKQDKNYCIYFQGKRDSR